MLQFEERCGLRRDGVRTRGERRCRRWAVDRCRRGDADRADADPRNGNRGGGETAGDCSGARLARDLKRSAFGRRERRYFSDARAASCCDAYRFAVDLDGGGKGDARTVLGLRCERE